MEIRIEKIKQVVCRYHATGLTKRCSFRFPFSLLPAQTFPAADEHQPETQSELIVHETPFAQEFVDEQEGTDKTEVGHEKKTKSNVSAINK